MRRGMPSESGDNFGESSSAREVSYPPHARLLSARRFWSRISSLSAAMCRRWGARYRAFFVASSMSTASTPSSSASTSSVVGVPPANARTTAARAFRGSAVRSARQVAGITAGVFVGELGVAVFVGELVFEALFAVVFVGVFVVPMLRTYPIRPGSSTSSAASQAPFVRIRPWESLDQESVNKKVGAETLRLAQTPKGVRGRSRTRARGPPRGPRPRSTDR